jgi:hypothetical protein
VSAYEWDIFIAHAGADLDAAKLLFRLLDSHARVFLDTERLRLGDNWDEELAKAQQRSRVTVVLVSSRTDGAYYQREEIAAAISLARSGTEKSHRVVPLYLEPAVANAGILPYGLRLKHGLHLSVDLNLELAATKLLDLLSTTDPEFLDAGKARVARARSRASNRDIVAAIAREFCVRRPRVA